MSILLAFFFNTWLIKDDKNKNINYALAVLMASTMARSGITMGSVMVIAELIFVLIMHQALKASFGEKYKWAPWIVSVFLIAWASAALTAPYPDSRGMLGKIGCSIPGVSCTDAVGSSAAGLIGGLLGGFVILKFIIPFVAAIIVFFIASRFMPWWGAALIAGLVFFIVFSSLGISATAVFIVIALILGLITFSIIKSNKRASSRWQGLRKFGFVPMLRALKKSGLGPIKWLMRKWPLREPYFENELPPIFNDLRAELMILMNYQTRLHTYFGKRTSVENIEIEALGIEGNFKDAYITYGQMVSSLNGYRSKGKGSPLESTGWSNNRELITFIFNRLKTDLARVPRIEWKYEQPQTIIETPLKNSVAAKYEEMTDSYSKYKQNVRRFGLIHRLKSLRTALIDLLALYGVYKHYYHFANEHSLYEKWKITMSPEEKSDPVIWSYTLGEKDKEYEEEKNSVIKVIKKEHLEKIRNEKIKQKRDLLYSKTKADIHAAVDKQIREKYLEYKKKKGSVPPEILNDSDKFGKVVNRAIKNAINKREEEILRQVDAEIKGKWVKRIKSKEVNEESKREELYNQYKDQMKQTIEPKLRERYEKYKENINKITEDDEIIIISYVRKYLTEKDPEIKIKVENKIKELRDEIESESLEELEKPRYQDEMFINDKRLEKYKISFVESVPGLGRLRHEVDIKGFVLNDIHEIEIDHKEKGFIRRVRIQDIEEFPGGSGDLASYKQVIPRIKQEWDAFLQDLRFGSHHPSSRSSRDYTTVVDDGKGALNFNDIPITKPSHLENRPAFDLEALRFAGTWVYWGKRNYWDDFPEQKNPFPTISTAGLSRFLTSIVNQTAKDNTIADKYLGYWVWDTGRADEPFTTVLGKEEKQ